jgi:flavin reductase (DIM6/NTAB) family NADH-FMN oxidoreductase RutF
MANNMAFHLKPLPLSEVYKVLEPGPVVLVSAAGIGRPNVMTLSWHTMMDFEPPLIGICLSERNYTFGMIQATRECVIAVPTVELAPLVVGVGNSTGRHTNKFRRFNIVTLPASRVHPPLLPQCWVNIECVVEDRSWVKKYNFFVLKAVKAWVNPDLKNPHTLHHRGKGYFEVAGKTIKLPSKMK